MINTLILLSQCQYHCLFANGKEAIDVDAELYDSRIIWKTEHTLAWVTYSSLLTDYLVESFNTRGKFWSIVNNWLIDLRPCQHDNGSMDGRSQVKDTSSQRSVFPGGHQVLTGLDVT